MSIKFVSLGAGLPVALSKLELPEVRGSVFGFCLGDSSGIDSFPGAENWKGLLLVIVVSVSGLGRLLRSRSTLEVAGTFVMTLSGFHQVALWLGLNGLRPQGLKEYSDDYLALDNLGLIMGSKCLEMQTTGNYLGLRPSEETSERMFQVAIWTFNLLYYFPLMYTYWSHFSG
jgi:hypothetical protein